MVRWCGWFKAICTFQTLDMNWAGLEYINSFTKFYQMLSGTELQILVII
jgi:hypothetical protein